MAERERWRSPAGLAAIATLLSAVGALITIALTLGRSDDSKPSSHQTTASYSMSSPADGTDTSWAAKAGQLCSSVQPSWVSIQARIQAVNSLWNSGKATADTVQDKYGQLAAEEARLYSQLSSGLVQLDAPSQMSAAINQDVNMLASASAKMNEASSADANHLPSMAEAAATQANNFAKNALQSLAASGATSCLELTTG